MRQRVREECAPKEIRDIVVPAQYCSLPNILSYPVKTQGNFPKISIILARALVLLGATTEYRYREIPTRGLFGQEIEDERFLGEEQMSYVESNLVPGEVVIYQTRLHWIVMLGHVVLGCLLLGLSGVPLYYALSQTGIESGKLHIMEGGGVGLLVCGVVEAERFSEVHVPLVTRSRKRSTLWTRTNTLVTAGTQGDAELVTDKVDPGCIRLDALEVHRPLGHRLIFSPVASAKTEQENLVAVQLVTNRPNELRLHRSGEGCGIRYCGITLSYPTVLESCRCSLKCE